MNSMASPWPVFWIACVAVFLVGLDGTMLFAAFGAIRTGFPETSTATLSWVVNAYTVVYAGMLVPAGRLADAQGRKRIFLLGVAVFLAASAACGLAPTAAWLIAARALQAVGAALLTPASLALILAAFPPGRRSVAVSLWGAVGGLAAAVGPSLGSFVVDAIGWPWAFYLNLPLGALSLWKGATRLERDPPPAGGQRIDAVGMVLLMLSVSAMALGIVKSGSRQWTRLDGAAVAAVALTALAGFVIHTRRAREPLLDLGLFRDRSFNFIHLATLAFGAAFSMTFFGYFLFLTGVWHYSLPRAGLAVTPGPLLVMPAAIFAGRLAARLGHRPFLIGGALVHAAGSLWFSLLAGPEPAYLTHWLPGVMLGGIGVGWVLPSLSAAAASRLPADQYAVGSAVNQAIRQIGSVLGVAVIVLLVGHANPRLDEFAQAYAMQALLAILTALLCLPVVTRGH
jgi:EmrB/QacA subfamily drug resistance transporter